MANTTEKKFGGWENGTSEIQAFAQENAPDTIRKLVGLMRQSKDPKIQLAAAREILDRGYGRPAEMIKPRIQDSAIRIHVVYEDTPPRRAVVQSGALQIKSPVATENDATLIRQKV